MNTSKYFRCLLIICFSTFISLSSFTVMSQAQPLNKSRDEGIQINVDLTEIVIASLVLGFGSSVLNSFRSKK